MSSTLPDRKEQACYAIFNEFRHAADARCDGGNFAGHGFKGGESEGLERAGHDHQVGQRQQLVYAVLLAEEVNPVIDFEIVRQPFSGGAIGAIADEDQLSRNFAHHLCEDLYHIDDALDGTEV